MVVRFILMLAAVAGIILVPGSLQAQADPRRSVGFKQFRLGMTREEVEQIVKTSIWEDDSLFGTSLFGTEMPLTPYERHLRLEGAQILADSETDRLYYPEGSLDSLHRALLTISCDSSLVEHPCARIISLCLLFYNKRVCAIYLPGEGFTDADAADERSWNILVDGELTRTYGGARYHDATLAKYTVADYRTMKPGEYPLAVWQLPKSRYGSTQSISILVHRFGGERTSRPLASSLIFEDRDNADLLYKAIHREAEARETRPKR